jgi:type I restriction enzyme S subunit
MSWEKYKLSDLYDAHNGLSKGRQFFGTGYGFLSFSTVFNNYFIPEELPDLVQTTEKEQENYSIKRGDIFVTRTSETSDELGMSCVALKDYPHATYNGFTKRLRPLTNKVLPEYIGYYLRMPSFRRNFMAFSTMTTRASLKNDDILGLEIDLPDYDTQSTIANILGTYDDLIENNQKQIKLLEEATQRIYKEWFVDLRFPGHENTEIENGMPNTWKTIQAMELCKITIGKTPPRSESYWFTDKGGIPWVSISDMNDAVFLFNTKEQLTGEAIKRNSVKVVPRGTILLSFKLTVGRVAIAEKKMATNEAIAHFYVDDTIREYLFCYLSNFNFDVLGSTSSISKAINSKIVKSMPIVLPDNETLTKFHDKVKSLFLKIENCQKNIYMLSEARDRLLPKLMSGEIEV